MKLNQDQKNLLKIIIDYGDKTNNYMIFVNDIVKYGENKNDKSVRSKLTTSKMKTLIKYNVKTVNNEASVQLLDSNNESTFEKVNEILNQE